LTGKKKEKKQALGPGLINFSRERHDGGTETPQNFLIAALKIYPKSLCQFDWNHRNMASAMFHSSWGQLELLDFSFLTSAIWRYRRQVGLLGTVRSLTGPVYCHIMSPNGSAIIFHQSYILLFVIMYEILGIIDQWKSICHLIFCSKQKNRKKGTKLCGADYPLFLQATY
jgi:hypothetical protein